MATQHAKEGFSTRLPGDHGVRRRRLHAKLSTLLHRRDVTAAAACLLFAAPAAATVFIFPADGHPQSHLIQARKFADTCANIHVRFRIGARPTPQGEAALARKVARLESWGYPFYIAAGSSDYGIQHLLWRPGIVCRDLQEPHAAGLYLHEILSGTIGTGHKFGEADWKVIGEYASCASRYHKQIIWSEFAGGNWGWSTFMNQISRPGSPAHAVISRYRHVFTFLWADNRNIRRPDQRADMMLARRVVQRLGSRSNPIGYAFPHGISLQDWLWFEMNRNARGRVAPDAGKTMPPSMISHYGITGYDNGARYFEFEAYWMNPRFLTGIAQLRSHILRARTCPETPVP